MVEQDLAYIKRTEKHRRRVAYLGTANFARVRRCFWTWPLGHRYKDGKCVACSKTEYLSSLPY